MLAAVLENTTAFTILFLVRFSNVSVEVQSFIAQHGSQFLLVFGILSLFLWLPLESIVLDEVEKSTELKPNEA